MALYIYPPLQTIGASTPIRFLRDTGGGPISVEVIEDTVTPGNNLPLPVKLTSVTGDINITANDLNVQTSHSAATPDSMQIGDGVEILQITATGQAQVKATDLETALGNLLTELQAKADLAETQPVSAVQLPATLGEKAEAASLAVTLSTENEALLTSIDGKDFATQTTLAALLTELQLKADLTETQPVSAASLPLPTGAATEATLAAQSAKLPATIGQKASAASLAVALSTEQEAMIDGIEGLLTTIDADTGVLAAVDYATETTLAAQSAKLPASLGEKAEAASLSVTLSTENDAILAAIQTATESAARLTVVDQLDTPLFDASSTNINGSAGAFVELVASTAAAVKKIQIIDDIGEFMGIYTGAAASEVLLAVTPLGGGEIEVNIPLGTRISVRNMKAAAITTGNMAINFLG